MTRESSRIHGRDRTDAATCALCRRQWCPVDFDGDGRDPETHNEYRVVPGPHPLAERGVVGGGASDREGEAVHISVCGVCRDAFWPNTASGYAFDHCLACKRTAAEVPEAFEADARIPTKRTDPTGDWLAICDDCLAAFREGRRPEHVDGRYRTLTAKYDSLYLDDETDDT